MKIVCVWRDNTDYAREVTMWMNDFKHDTGKDVENFKNKEELTAKFENLKSNTQLIEMVKKHPYIQNTENNIEKILDDTEFYSSMIIFLNVYADIYICNACRGNQ